VRGAVRSIVMLAGLCGVLAGCSWTGSAHQPPVSGGTNGWHVKLAQEIHVLVGQSRTFNNGAVKYPLRVTCGHPPYGEMMTLTMPIQPGHHGGFTGIDKQGKWTADVAVDAQGRSTVACTSAESRAGITAQAYKSLALLRTQSLIGSPLLPAVASLRCSVRGSVATCRGTAKDGGAISARFVVQRDGSLRCPSVRWDNGNAGLTQRTRATCAVTGAISVPNVIGLNAYYATLAIRNAGLCTTGVDQRVTRDAGKGFPILRESPEAGTRVARGTGISLVMGDPGYGGVPRAVGLCASK
jgi:hypothetical protein